MRKVFLDAASPLRLHYIGDLRRTYYMKCCICIEKFNKLVLHLQVIIRKVRSAAAGPLRVHC